MTMRQINIPAVEMNQRGRRPSFSTETAPPMAKSKLEICVLISYAL